MCKLFIAPAHTLRVEANGEAPLFITHLGHTKIFFFSLWWLPALFFSLPFLLSFFPLHPHSCILSPARTQTQPFPAAHFCLTDQLMFLFLFVEQDSFCFFCRSKDVVRFLFFPPFVFLHSGLSSSLCYVTERTEAITQCALYPTKRLVQQVAV